jgi:hypothetical protein
MSRRNRTDRYKKGYGHVVVYYDNSKQKNGSEQVVMTIKPPFGAVQDKLYDSVTEQKFKVTDEGLFIDDGKEVAKFNKSTMIMTDTEVPTLLDVFQNLLDEIYDYKTVHIVVTPLGDEYKFGNQHFSRMRSYLNPADLKDSNK